MIEVFAMWTSKLGRIGSHDDVRKRAILFFAAGILAFFALAPRASQAVDLWGEAFGGAAFPISQDDNDVGPQFGLRLPIHLTPLLQVEPFYSNSRYGTVTKSFAGFPYDRSGIDVHAGGVNVAARALAWEPRLDFLPYIGIGFYHLGRPGLGETHGGYNFGVQTNVRLGPALAVNARGEFNMIVDNGISRKSANVLVGLRYRFYSTP